MKREKYRWMMVALLAASITAFVTYKEPESVEEPKPPEIVSRVEAEEPETETEEETEVPAKPLVMVYDVPLDFDLQLHIMDACKEHGIDPAVIMAMIERESGFDVDRKGDSGKSYGLMQIQKHHHEDRMERLGVTDLMDPYQNVLVGIDYLAELHDKYDGNIEMALMAYNAGPTGAYRNWFSAGVYSNKYSQTILANSETLTEGMIESVRP